MVDASQGVEAQTVANCYTALDLGVEVVPILNKIDLPHADPDNAKQEIEDVIGLDASDATTCSAKTGLGVEDVLETLIAKVPPPEGDPDAPLQALIVDSWYDPYVGVVMLVRVVNGTLRPKDKILLMATDSQQLVEQVGVFSPRSVQLQQLTAGQVGFVIAGIKELKAAKVGGTCGSRSRSCARRSRGTRAPARTARASRSTSSRARTRGAQHRRAAGRAVRRPRGGARAWCRSNRRRR